MGGRVLMVLAVPWLLLGAGAAVRTARFLAVADSGIAEVVSSHEEPCTRGRCPWTTTFALLEPGRPSLTARWTGERAFAPGEAVQVRFRRAPLARIQPHDQWTAWGWAWVLGGAGGGHLLVGGAMVFAGSVLRKRPRTST